MPLNHEVADGFLKQAKEKLDRLKYEKDEDTRNRLKRETRHLLKEALTLF